MSGLAAAPSARIMQRMAVGRSAPPSDRKNGRIERLAAALRENLRRRKAQARGRHASSQGARQRELAKEDEHGKG